MPTLKLPVGDRPGWEHDEQNASSLKPVADSGVLFYALRQSRDRLLFRTFPRFTSASGKIPEPPSHSLQRRARCNIQIGPHTFDNVTFYEAHYQHNTSRSFYVAQSSLVHPQGTPQFMNAVHASTSATQLANNPNPPSRHDILVSEYLDPSARLSSMDQSKNMDFAPHEVGGISPLPHESAHASNDSLPSGTSFAQTTQITPALIRQVAAAAAGDERLAQIVTAASQGTATAEQFRELSKAIRELYPAASSATSIEPLHATPQPSHPASSSFSASNLQRPQSSSSIPSNETQFDRSRIRGFDLVIEFQEAAGERFVIPIGPTACKPLSQSSGPLGILYDLDLSVTTTPDGCDAPQRIDVHLKEAPSALLDTLQRWIGSEPMQERDTAILGQMRTKRPCYLAHQLKGNDPLLSRIQATLNTNSAYPMRNANPEVNYRRAKRKRVEEGSVPPSCADAPDASQPNSDLFRPYKLPADPSGVDNTPLITVWRASTSGQSARTQHRRESTAAIALADIKRGPPQSKSGSPGSAALSTATVSDHVVPFSGGVSLIQPYERRADASPAGRSPGDYHDSASEVVMLASPRRPPLSPYTGRDQRGGPVSYERAPSNAPYAATQVASSNAVATSQTPTGPPTFPSSAPKSGVASVALPTKRRRHENRAASTATPQAQPLRCNSCQQTGIPLISAGICRQCVEAGRAVGEIPPEPKYIYSTPPSYASRSPVDLRHAVAMGHGLQEQGQGFSGESRGLSQEPAISALPGPPSLHAEDRARGSLSSAKSFPYVHGRNTDVGSSSTTRLS